MLKVLTRKQSSLECILDENNALQKLSGILDNYVPWSASALRAGTVVKILNDVVINSRRRLVEFGSGVSTLYIAAILAKLDDGTTFVSIEHDKQWLEVLSKLLDREGLSQHVSLIHAPLSEHEGALEGCRWYSPQALQILESRGKFDLVLVDGPPAYRKDLALSRAPAIPYLLMNGLLDKRYSVWLDDIDRPGERKIMKIWSEALDNRFVLDELNNIGYCMCGEAFNID